MSHRPIFDKILIANRGEIACRVIKSCRRLGIKSVAVHSTADEQAKHVNMADERICVGPPQSKDSYLRIDKIIDACIKTKANAVHPGYGFLSENAEFSAELKKNNIVFIGPDAHSIEAMGDKIQSKVLAAAAKVTTIPGYNGEITNEEMLLEKANEIGYPVMVKASGGGGGKGMRVAYDNDECVKSFRLCKEEAMSAFGNDMMLVEKFIEKPRHIEIQVIADRCGNTVYLPERECSIQRRNQKVIEEAPSTFIDPKTRKAMGEEAAAMARAVDYVTAGTVEMVVGPNRQFYFLEMNTRLQVEHPITELITGVDLVEQMIRASAGLPLSVKQEDIKINGWATEARVYAEDPTRNYFPSIGRLTQYSEPEGHGVRVDSGILEGSQISVFYDPLIAKLCTWGQTRNDSLDRMGQALDKYVIRGLSHNVCLLRDVMNEEAYRHGDITTNYLMEKYPDGFKQAKLTAGQEMRLRAVAASMHAMRIENRNAIGRYGSDTVSATLETCRKGEEKEPHAKFDVLAKSTTADTVEFHIVNQHGEKGTLMLHWNIEEPLIKAVTTGFGLAQPETEFLQFIGCDELSYRLQYRGSIFEILVMNETQSHGIRHMNTDTGASATKDLRAPMPGLVININVMEGDQVVFGQELCTLEAMKMRNKLLAENDGKVKSVKCREGETVDDDDLMIEIE